MNEQKTSEIKLKNNKDKSSFMIWTIIILISLSIPVIYRLIEEVYRNYQDKNCEIVSLSCPPDFPFEIINKTENKFCCYINANDPRGTCGKQLIIYKC